MQSGNPSKFSWFTSFLREEKHSVLYSEQSFVSTGVLSSLCISHSRFMVRKKLWILRIWHWSSVPSNSPVTSGGAVSAAISSTSSRETSSVTMWVPG